MVNIFLIVLIIGTIVAFSVQNAVSVTVTLFLWQLETSFMTITAVAVLAGILIAQLLQAASKRRQADARRSLEFWSRRHRW